MELIQEQKETEGSGWFTVIEGNRVVAIPLAKVELIQFEGREATLLLARGQVKVSGEAAQALRELTGAPLIEVPS